MESLWGPFLGAVSGSRFAKSSIVTLTTHPKAKAFRLRYCAIAEVGLLSPRVYTQSPHFEDRDFPVKFPGEVVLTEPGAQRTKGELDCMMDVSSSFV
jgi:hypothetical protein